MSIFLNKHHPKYDIDDFIFNLVEDNVTKQVAIDSVVPKK